MKLLKLSKRALLVASLVAGCAISVFASELTDLQDLKFAIQEFLEISSKVEEARKEVEQLEREAKDAEEAYNNELRKGGLRAVISAKYVRREADEAQLQYKELLKQKANLEFALELTGLQDLKFKIQEFQEISSKVEEARKEVERLERKVQNAEEAYNNELRNGGLQAVIRGRKDMKEYMRGKADEAQLQYKELLKQKANLELEMQEKVYSC